MHPIPSPSVQLASPPGRPHPTPGDDMTQDWAWRIVFMDERQYLVRGTIKNSGIQMLEFSSDIPPLKEGYGPGVDGRIPTVYLNLEFVRYFIRESPAYMDWPDGVYIMRLPDTDAAPPKPEG